MRRLKMWEVGLRIMLASSLVGTTFQAGCLGTVARNFNPCGTILACDPVEWDLMYHDYPDWDLDPTCTIPGLCGGNWPPTSASGGGAAEAGGTTVTTTGDYGAYGGAGYTGYGAGYTGTGGGYGASGGLYGGGYGGSSYGYGYGGY